MKRQNARRQPNIDEPGFAFNPERDFVTENLAGRGEGLAGLVTQRIKECRETAKRWKTESRIVRTKRAICKDYSAQLDALASLLETALEAAAPASTGSKQDFDLGYIAGIEVAALRAERNQGTSDATKAHAKEIARQIRELPLATHSLQAPPDCFYCHNAHVMGHECTCVCHGSPRKVGEDGALRERLCERITSYLTLGGLFNAELANHDAVRELLIDCRVGLSLSSPIEPNVATTLLRKWRDYAEEMRKGKAWIVSAESRDLLKLQVEMAERFIRDLETL